MRILFVLTALLFLSSCSSKIVAKNCHQADEEYFVCESLSISGK